MDPKTTAVAIAIATAVLGGAARFLWGRGVAAGEAAMRKKIEQLRAKHEAAKKTPGTRDDDETKRDLERAEQLLAGIEGL